MLDKKNITALRMQRQGFQPPADKNNYDELFRCMSPVPTIYWCRPGMAPCLPLHAAFNDEAYNNEKRRKRELLKGRFQSGTIGYVTEEDFPLYAALYQKDLVSFGQLETELLELLEQEGPLTIGQLREATGFLAKEITPVLHKLQKHFLIYEDQVDDDWERGWALLSSELSYLKMGQFTKSEALMAVLTRFSRLHVFFDQDMAKSFYKLPVRSIQSALEQLVQDGTLCYVEIDGQKGYLLKEDHDYLTSHDLELKPAVFALHRNDFLVKSLEYKLKAEFSHPSLDIIQYLLIDGELKGAVLGKFKNGPFLLEDVTLSLPQDITVLRRNEIIEAIYQVNDRDASPLKKYGTLPCS